VIEARSAICGSPVADLAIIRYPILPADAPQAAAKVSRLWGLTCTCLNAVQHVLPGLDRDDVQIGRVELAQQRIERRRFAASRRAGEQTIPFGFL
jgi:hypothetical protein